MFIQPLQDQVLIQAAVSKMSNGEKYVCIARTVEKGVGRFGKTKSILSIGLGCEAKYAKDFVYTENLNINDKKPKFQLVSHVELVIDLIVLKGHFLLYIKNLM